MFSAGRQTTGNKWKIESLAKRPPILLSVEIMWQNVLIDLFLRLISVNLIYNPHLSWDYSEVSWAAQKFVILNPYSTAEPMQLQNSWAILSYPKVFSTLLPEVNQSKSYLQPWSFLSYPKLPWVFPSYPELSWITKIFLSWSMKALFITLMFSKVTLSYPGACQYAIRSAKFPSIHSKIGVIMIKKCQRLPFTCLQIV